LGVLGTKFGGENVEICVLGRWGLKIRPLHSLIAKISNRELSIFKHSFLDTSWSFVIPKSTYLLQTK
jgi:hypothetical protein